MVYIATVFYFNWYVCYIFPVSTILSVADKLDLVFKWEKGDQNHDKSHLEKNQLARALFIAYGNMFTMIGPIEAKTHLRTSKIVLLQIGRFIVNNFTLVFIMALIWSPSSTFQRKEMLTCLSIVIFIFGILSLILLMNHFYQLKPRTNDNYFGK